MLWGRKKPRTKIVLLNFDSQRWLFELFKGESGPESQAVKTKRDKDIYFTVHHFEHMETQGWCD